MDQSFVSFRQDLAKMKNTRKEGGKVFDYGEALELVRDRMGEKLNSIMERQGEEKKEKQQKNKAFLREKLARYTEYVTEIVYSENIRVRGYEEQDQQLFIREMAHEFGGYSILADAFEDDTISDIFILSWNEIIVEKSGVNTPYDKTFRSPKHYKDVLDRFIREAGKEINNGDQKIVDFELFGDRGCATSTAVSPKDYSLTIRKHAEDHIVLEQLVEWNVFTPEMSELLGLMVQGETNLIYGGITGSGKTTTIRAILDHYVTQQNKRMLVCEDTQELFPQNKHTLELVSVKNDDPKLAVPLDELIITGLRLKPKYIVVGEVRGKEAQAAVEGMETGHSTFFTMHGGDSWNVINRLVTKYLTAMPSLDIKIAERIIGNALDFICIQDNIPGIGHKLTQMDEVTFNFEKQQIELKPIFRFDTREKEFVAINKLSMSKANTMMRRGVPWEKLEKWVEAE